MEKSKESGLPALTPQILGLILGAVAILTLSAFIAYQYAKKRSSTIVIPGGVTYLGPSSTPSPTQQSGKIIIPPDSQWSEHRGQTFPYTFSYPSNLSLGIFPNDPYDSVTIFWGNTNPQENLILRVEDLNKLPDGKQYIQKSKREYVETWWKQYAWKGLESVAEFTNSHGLKGYRAKFLNEQGETPYDNIFFEVPGRPDLVVWMASNLLAPDVFDQVIDSLAWQENTTNPTN